MELNIHPNAITNFNNKAEQLLFVIETRKQQLNENKPSNDFHVDKILDASKFIGDVIGHDVNAAGKELSVYIIEKNNLIGLFDINYKDYIRICESIQCLKEINNLVSLKVIKKILFSWLMDKFKRQSVNEFMPYFIEIVLQEIKDNIIYIPIHGLVLESDFHLGHIQFLKITKEMIEHWETYMLSKDLKKDTSIIEERKSFILKLRRDLQGYSVASSKIFAEPERAQEIALEYTEKSLSALRFFAKANFNPENISSCTVLGKENIESIRYLFIDNTGNLINYNQGIINNVEFNWKIDNNNLKIISELGLVELHKLLLSDTLSVFQNKLLESIMMYSKNSLMKTINDKLIYILISLESMLLKNPNESIVQNIGERIAFLIADNFKDRKQIINNVKDIYDLRSKFIHHGLTIDNVEKLESFMIHVNTFFIQLLKNMNFFKDKEHLINFIEEKKLS